MFVCVSFLNVLKICVVELKELNILKTILCFLPNFLPLCCWDLSDRNEVEIVYLFIVWLVGWLVGWLVKVCLFETLLGPYKTTIVLL